jgi:hypothetical protein
LRLITRTAVAVALLAAGATAPGAHAQSANSPWSPDGEAAAKYAKERRGVEAFYIRTANQTGSHRGRASYFTASVLKPMLMVAYLNRDTVRDRRLRSADKNLLRPMITRSDNTTATRILGIVGTKGLRKVARRARMKSFVPVVNPWGHSRTTAEDQANFFFRIDALIPERHRTYAMDLLHDIVPSQRWGIGQVELPGWELYFKGGWGSGTGAVDHQVALLTGAGPNDRISVAIMTADDGTHAYGKETLRGIAKRLLNGLPDNGVAYR